MKMEWVRLWHDMPTDPKFRTVSKISKQPLSTIIAVYVFLMVDASCHTMSRGVTLCHNEDIASALDLEVSQIEDIKKAMQGKLLDGNKLTGWEKRNPKKEDETAAERQRRHREQKKENECHAMSHDVTKSHAREEKRREDKQEVIDNKQTTTTVVGRRALFVSLLEKYFSSEEVISMLRSASGQSMLTAWVEAEVAERAVTSVLDDWIATGQPLKTPAYYRNSVLNFGKVPPKAHGSRREETPEEYEARILIKAREATEMTLKAIAEREAEKCKQNS